MTQVPCSLLVDIGDSLAEVLPDQAEAFYLEALDQMRSMFGDQATLLVLPKLCDFYLRRGLTHEFEQKFEQLNRLKEERGS